MLSQQVDQMSDEEGQSGGADAAADEQDPAVADNKTVAAQIRSERVDVEAHTRGSN